MKQIFPKEIIENTIQVHQFENTTKSKIIYTTILIVIVLLLIALPFVEVDVYKSQRYYKTR